MTLTQRVSNLAAFATVVTATLAASTVMVPYLGVSYVMINVIHAYRKYRDGTL